MKNLILVALVAFVSWQALAVTDVNAKGFKNDCPYRQGKTLLDTPVQQNRWAGLEPSAAPAKAQPAKRVATAPGTDNRGG